MQHTEFWTPFGDLALDLDDRRVTVAGQRRDSPIRLLAGFENSELADRILEGG